MKPERIEEIRAIIADIRIAEQTGEGRRRLWSDAKAALLELLDEKKAPEAETYRAYLAESCRDGEWGFQSLCFDPEDAAGDIAGNGYCGRVQAVQFKFDPDEAPEPVCRVEWEPELGVKCEDCLAREGDACSTSSS